MADVPAPLERGYHVGFDPDAADFRVYTLGILGAGLIGLWFLGHGAWAFYVGAAFIVTCCYFLPLANKSAARLAANDMGICIEGLGVLAWDKIADVRMLNVAVRTMSNRDLVISLREPLDRALLEDWRAPFPLGYLMFQFWRVSAPDTVRVNLEVLAREPERTFNAVKAVQKDHQPHVR